MIQGVSILEFLNVLIREEKTINEYGTEDPRYQNSYNELTATFCVRVYKNIIPMVMEVLENMKTKIVYEKTICLSHGIGLLSRSRGFVQVC